MNIKHQDTIEDILNRIRPDIDLRVYNNLIEDNVIDSVDVIEIIVSLEKHYSINIELKDIEPKHFKNVATLSQLVDFYLNE